MESALLSCVEDEGRPLGTGFPEQVSNQPELLRCRQRRYFNTISNAGINYGAREFRMEMTRKITVEVRADLLRKAQEASGSGITETVRAGLELMAASRAYAHLLRLRGKVHFSRSLSDLKADR
jgi:hypothetical protein